MIQRNMNIFPEQACYIPHNYTIPQVIPHAMSLTHYAFNTLTPYQHVLIPNFCGPQPMRPSEGDPAVAFSPVFWLASRLFRWGKYRCFIFMFLHHKMLFFFLSVPVGCQCFGKRLSS